MPHAGGREATQESAGSGGQEPMSQEQFAAIRLRAMANLEALSKQLALVVPLLLALAAGLMAGKAAMTVSGAELPLAFAQFLVSLSTAFAFLHCGRLSFALSRDLRATPDEDLRESLRNAPLALNPFYCMPQGPSGFVSRIVWLLGLIPLCTIGLIIGFAAVFIFPIDDVPALSEEATGNAILGLTLLHTCAIAAALLGSMAMLWSFGAKWRVGMFFVAAAAGIYLGCFSVQVVQQIQAQAI